MRESVIVIPQVIPLRLFNNISIRSINSSTRIKLYSIVDIIFILRIIKIKLIWLFVVCAPMYSQPYQLSP